MSELSQEPKRVNVEEPSSAAYWARRFQVPVEQVTAAVEAVGDEPAVVAEHLDRPWPYDGSGIV